MNIQTIEKNIGYVFKDKELLREALTHSSYSFVHGGRNYDRLEYLGDALLDFTVAEELYRRFPEADEGELTRRRVALVSEEPLIGVSKRLGLDKEMAVQPHHKGKGAVFSDVFESVAAAIYLDGGIDEAKAFILRSLSDAMDGASDAEETEGKTALYEKYGKEGVEFVLEDRGGPAHAPRFTIALYVGGKFAARAQAGSKKGAEKECARLFFEKENADS